MTYRHNTYACKIVGATIRLEVLVAKLLPSHREEALAIARNAARFLMEQSRPEGAPLAFFPPTYYSDLISSSRAENRGKTMTMEACAAGNAFLDLYDATGDRIYYDRALAIAETYSRLQHADGIVPDQGRFRDRGAGQRLQGEAHAGHGVFRTTWRTGTASPATATASPGPRSGCTATPSKASI